MMRRSCLALMYAGTSNRWVQAAVSPGEAKLSQQCVWQWKQSAARAHSACQRIEAYRCFDQPVRRRK